MLFETLSSAYNVERVNMVYAGYVSIALAYRMYCYVSWHDMYIKQCINDHKTPLTPLALHKRK